MTVFHTRFKPKALLPLCLSQCDDTQQMRCLETIFSADIKTGMRGCLLPWPHYSTVPGWYLKEAIPPHSPQIYIYVYYVYIKYISETIHYFPSVTSVVFEGYFHPFIHVGALSCMCCISLCDLSEKCAFSAVLRVCHVEQVHKL